MGQEDLACLVGAAAAVDRPFRVASEAAAAAVDRPYRAAWAGVAAGVLLVLLVLKKKKDRTEANISPLKPTSVCVNISQKPTSVSVTK